MAFSRENYARIRAEMENRRRSAAEESERRKFLLHTEIPRLGEIDRAVASVGVRVMQAALAGGDVDSAVAQMRAENAALRAERAALLRAHGYPEDYTDIRFRCEKCGDTGFVGTAMCSCMRQELILAGFESSGIGTLARTQSFENFSLAYYRGDARVQAEANVSALRDFAQHFGERKSGNWLLIGPTGLGKTHLSTSVARVVIESGYDVVYDTAQGMFSAFESARFGRGSDGDGERYLDCELLIVDDLGTELTNNFTVSCLYNVINTRLNARRSTIINTNLSSGELRTRYADRITSRLFGEFRPLIFSGTDIRAQKLRT